MNIVKAPFIPTGVIITYDLGNSAISATDFETYTQSVNNGIPTLSTSIIDLKTRITCTLPSTTLYHNGNVDSAKTTFLATLESLNSSKGTKSILKKILIVEIGDKWGLAFNA